MESEKPMARGQGRYFPGGWLSSAESHLCLAVLSRILGRVSGRDCLGVAGQGRLRDGGLSLLVHPRLGSGAVSDPQMETAAAASAPLRGVKGSPAAPTLPLGYRARLSEPAGLCRGVAAVFCDVVRYLSLISIFLLRGGGPRISA